MDEVGGLPSPRNGICRQVRRALTGGASSEELPQQTKVAHLTVARMVDQRMDEAQFEH
jgi:hypothetical protein